MKVPISWLKDFVEITLPIEELAKLLTLAGLEVEEIHYVGLPLPTGRIEGRSGAHIRQETKISGFEWQADKIVVGAVHEVLPHPNADRLVLCRLDDGTQEHIVLTGAPNLFPYKGVGPLPKALKVAYAREGAQIIDGHQPGHVITTLERATIRGIESYSMACSEKELGISDEHAGVIILDDSAPVGTPLVEYMGDAVLDISLTPNLARDANIYGVAREVAALSAQELRPSPMDVRMDGGPITGRASIDILEPEYNPRFVLGLIEGIEIRPSPYEIQRRLRLAGMRPINNIVDATNYAMFELGEPLHAFDYDVLVQRAGGETPALHTRTARQGERLTTLDGVEHNLDDFTVLVCDTAGALSMAGVMGGLESEVSERTRNVLLEGAAWNYINIRRTIAAQHMNSEAAYRFSRGVHPAMADRGVRRGLELMRMWAGGVVSQGLVDNYPSPPEDPVVMLSESDIVRWLGISIPLDRVSDILRRLEFSVESVGQSLRVATPDYRLDIGNGVIGVADIIEEIARVYGYDRIPETRLADAIPPQHNDPELDNEERLRQVLVNLGLQEVITYRMTSPERESRLLPTGYSHMGTGDYLQILNPIVGDRNVMRRSLLSSLIEVVERNSRLQERLAIFEIGPVFLPGTEMLPEEPSRLGIIMTGPRHIPGWQPADLLLMDIYDLKGVINSCLEAFHLAPATYEPVEHPSFHPGKCARILLEGRALGVFGEIHPLVREHYELPNAPLLAAELDLTTLLEQIPARYDILPVPAYPPVLEDLAFVVNEAIPASQVEEVIHEEGGQMVIELRLFDFYRGEQAGAGKKSLAYRLTYQATDRTLTDQEVGQIRQKIVRELETKLGAKLRS